MSVRNTGLGRLLDRRNAALLGIGAAIAMALYTALYWDSNPPMLLLNGKPDRDRIDLFVEQVHGVKFDESGKQVETLLAERLAHYPERGESVLAKPILDTEGNDGKIWKITAETGTLINDDEIRLRDDVVIVDQTQTMRFESEWLDYFSKRQQAATDAAVKLQHQADVTTAIGMRADLAANRIELLRNVNSRYAGANIQPADQ